MHSFLRDLGSTITRYFAVAAAFLPWATIHAALAATGRGSTATRTAALVLGFATAALVWRRLDRPAAQHNTVYLALGNHDLNALIHHPGVRREVVIWATQARAEIEGRRNSFGSAGAIVIVKAAEPLPLGGWEWQRLNVKPEGGSPFIIIPEMQPGVPLPNEEPVRVVFYTDTAGAARLVYVN